jgi:hypothetical protein
MYPKNFFDHLKLVDEDNVNVSRSTDFENIEIVFVSVGTIIDENNENFENECAFNKGKNAEDEGNIVLSVEISEKLRASLKKIK